MSIHKKLLYILFVFSGLIFVNAQNNIEKNFDDKAAKDTSALKKLFKEKNFQQIIDNLNEKYKQDELELDEFYWYTKSHGRIGEYYSGYFLAGEMMRECLIKKDTTNLLKAINLKAESLTDMGKMRLGIEFCESAMPFFREKDSLSYQNLCFKWGVMYQELGDFKKADEIYKQIKSPKYTKLSIYVNNYATILEGLGHWDRAIDLYKKSIAIDKEQNDLSGISTSYSNIAKVYAHEEKWKLAEKTLDSAAKYFRKGKFKNKQNELGAKKELFHDYFVVYLKQKKHKRAYFTLELVSTINDEIFDLKVNEKIKSLESSYQREYKLKKRVEAIDDKLELSEKQKFWGAVLGFLAIITLLTFIFIYKYRVIKAAHENVVTEQKLLRSQMTPHFIFNSLSVLQGMILNKEDAKAVRYLSKFSKLLRLVLENSTEKLVPISEELQAIQNYVDLQNLGQSKQFAFSINVDDKLLDSEIEIPPMLIQPFVENAIEHGFRENIENPEISIKIFKEDKKLHCIITDNGVGVNTINKSKSAGKKKSLSTKITKERLKIFSKEYKVDSFLKIEDRSLFNEKGTKITLTLPYKNQEDA